MKKHIDVLVVGELNVDIIMNKIDGFPVMGKEILSKQLTVTLGSSSAIFASNLSTLGAKVAFLGKVGQDNFAALIIDTLKGKGVSTGFIINSKEYETGATLVLNYDMDRAMVTYPGAMEHLSQDEISPEILGQVKHLHVSSIFLQPALKAGIVELFKKAKNLGLTTSLDPQWDPSEKWDLDLEALLPFVDIFLPNRKEFKLITGFEDLKEGIEKIKGYCNIAVIKDGEDGALLWDGQQLIARKAFLNLEVADCIGAGDSFDAGFISQFIQNKDLDICLEFANLTGAINTTQSGGTTAFTSLDAVKSIAELRFSYSI